jgi:hypothetical protein
MTFMAGLVPATHEHSLLSVFMGSRDEPANDGET